MLKSLSNLTARVFPKSSFRALGSIKLAYESPKPSLGAHRAVKLEGKYDLPSIEEFLIPHKDSLKRRDGIKGMFTSDKHTIRAASDVLGGAGHSGDDGSNFHEKKIFSQPPHSSSEAKSIKVKVSDIRDFPKYRKQYEKNKGRSVMLCVGGPAAEDQVVLASVITGVREKLNDILYITRDYKESNVNHAAKQSHARHGNALNADSRLTGHSLIPLIVMRKLIGVSLEEALEPDFIKVDVEFTIDPKKLKIYFGNELNWLKQQYKKYKGDLTEHDINRLESLLSQEILNVLEKETGVKISGGFEKARTDASSIHVTFTEENSKEVREENEEYKRVGIEAKEMDPDEIELLFETEEIDRAWAYPGDTHLEFNAHEINEELAKKFGAKWLEGEEIDRILLTKNDEGNAEIAGVVTKDGEYIYASKLHFTGGYKVDYVFDRDSSVRFQSGSMIRNLANKVEDFLDLQRPLTSDVTVSTGVSINAVFKKSDKIKKLIDRFGSTGEIAVTNSHWTMIADNEEHLVMRITGGGNTGSEEYNPAYFLNVIANTRRIFGDDLIGVLSTYGCPRSINARNSTEFDKIAEGAVISYGKGGTGNTKRHAEAVFGLMILGFEEEVIKYYNQFQTHSGKLLGDQVSEIYEHFKDVEFLHDNTKKTNRRMGYDEDLSDEEKAAIGIMLLALSYIAYKGLTRDKKDDSIER